VEIIRAIRLAFGWVVGLVAELAQLLVENFK
jgi:hypothetical protein